MAGRRHTGPPGGPCPACCGVASHNRPVGRSPEAVRTEEITELDPPKSWTVRGVGGPLTAIAKGTIEPLDDGERSRVMIALEFEGQGIGTGLLSIVRRLARRQLPRNEQRL